MRYALVTAFGASLTLAGLSGAQAAPAGFVPTAAPLVENVAMGCGPGFFRGPRGFCRPMRGGYYGPRAYGPRFYGPRRYYGPRRFYGPRW